ncbi:Magnesium transport protein CorA [Clavibacter michiganensis subsp. michiganensis]|uniref:magnesium and cobalt transport protein CorA n=1 Tax=Clavibacter michiganensis TaxID=28447 RepID=UPI000B6F8D71|nr:magnesium and cobalt transport protein CorA [Clavibacter michiganensis]OUD96928.1 Magnesium transport protein CorA [Clavibacter michiganensis subsp. michiganensis]OUE06763.1 Magnesium transport protein CorA [Clavibacter michiganensis subsp. michiganensis]
MTVIDSAVYVQGVRTADPESLDETFEVMRERQGLAWIGLYRPDPEELHRVADEFGLHPLAVEDALSGHQRSKMERYGDTWFVVLRPARYVDADERVEFGELHVFVGPDFVVTIRHAESPDLAAVRHRLEEDRELLALGPRAVMYAILDQVVDEYGPVAAGLEDDVDEIEDQIFGADPDVSRRIYALMREVTAFQRATAPLGSILDDLRQRAEEHDVDLELRRGFRDVHDHFIRVAERADAFRTLLQNALTVHTTLVGQRQNDEMKKLTETSLAQNDQVKRISSWAAILFAPTLVGTIYGMNFVNMPELKWTYGYPLALGLMVVMGVILYAAFRKRGWI